MSANIDDIMLVMKDAFDPAFGEAWNRRQVEDALRFPHTSAIVHFTSDEEAAGFALSRIAADEEELLLLGVRPDFRRHGIGSALMKALCTDAAKRGAARLFLEMRDGNSALAFYRKHAFAPIGRRRDYYRGEDGVRYDAITFARELA